MEDHNDDIVRAQEQDDRLNEAFWSLPDDLEGILSRLHDPDPIVRLAVIDKLGGFGEPREVTALMEALDDESGPVRRDASLAFAAVSPGRAVAVTEQAVPSISRHALEDDRDDVRMHCVMALARAEDVDVTSVLESALDDSGEFVRAAACWSLATQYSDRSRERMIGLLLDSSPYVRYECALSLVEMEVKDARLVEGIQRFEDDELVEAVAEEREEVEIQGRVMQTHPETRQLLEEWLDGLDPEQPEEGPEFLDFVRERLGESEVPFPPQDPIGDLLQKARKLLSESGNSEEHAT